MPTSVRAITTRLAVDGEREFKKAMSEVNTTMRTLKSELELVDAQFKGQANTMEALRKKQEILKAQYDQQRESVKALEKAVKDSTEAHVKQGGSVDALDKRTLDLTRQLNRAKVAEIEMNDALEENAKYLKEAEESADGCAKSIDGYGKEVKKAADETNGATDGLSEFSDTLAGLKESVATGDIGGIVSSLGAMKGLLVGGAIVSGLKEVAEKIWDVAKAGAAYADDILTMSTVTGLSTDALQEYQYMADLVDVSVETITGSITKLTRNMLQAKDGTGEQAEAFAALGIQITNADGSLRDAQEVWDEVITALGQMSNETERDAYAMVLMGKSAQDLNPLIEAGADKINALRQEAHEAGAVLDEDMLATLGEMQDAFDRLSQQTKAFERILAGTLAPTITDIVNAIVGAVQQMGNFIQRVQEAKQAIDELAERNAAVGVAKESLGWIRHISLEGMISQIPFLNIPYNIYKGAKWLSGSHAAGLDRVPYDGYLAELHADEAVLNAQEAALWRSAARYGASGAPSASPPAPSPATAQSAARRENVTIDVTLELDGQTLARKQYPLMQAEGRRRGTPLAGKEGT